MKKITVSLAYHRLPAQMVVPLMGTVITGMQGKAELKNPPVPLTPPVPADPDAPVDLTTRKTQLEAAIEASAVGGKADTAVKNDALEFALDGLDQEAFFVQAVYRYDATGMLATGFVPASTNRAQVALDAPAITSIDSDVPAQLTLHVTPVDNAYGYEVQTRTGTGDLDHGPVFVPGALDRPARIDLRHGDRRPGAGARRPHRLQRLEHGRHAVRALTHMP
jgi:hypothetical protein